ncbi:MAG: hypothetical protein ACR2LL_13980 [Nitrosopumilus sp.]
MKKWADYLISEVNYDNDHLISIAIRHLDSRNGIGKGKSVDRLAMASDIKNGFSYFTIYHGKDSWKKGYKIQTFSLEGNPYFRIDENKVRLDYLGDLPEVSITSKNVQESSVQPLTEEEATPEQLDDLRQQLDELEDTLSAKLNSSSKVLDNDQSLKIEKLENEIKSLETDITEHKIIRTLEKQNKKLDNIEKKLHELMTVENDSLDPSSQEGFVLNVRPKEKS